MSSALTLKFIFFFQAMKISYLPQPFLSIMDSREQYSLGFLYSISSFLLNPLVVFTEQVLQIISLILLRINPFIFYFPAHPPLLHQIAYVLFSHRQTCQKTERLFFLPFDFAHLGAENHPIRISFFRNSASDGYLIKT